MEPRCAIVYRFAQLVIIANATVCMLFYRALVSKKFTKFPIASTNQLNVNIIIFYSFVDSAV